MFLLDENKEAVRDRLTPVEVNHEFAGFGLSMARSWRLGEKSYL